MSKHLERALDHLREQLISQFGTVEQMVELSVRSLTERRPDLADRVIETDGTVDQQDVLIEEECLKILALHQPVVNELRWLVTVIKLNGELERIADLACNIAERAKSLDLYPLFPVPEEITEMVTITLQMVKLGLDAFVEGDTDKAADVIRRDDQVDRLNRVVIGSLHETMKSDPETIVPAVHCFSASRHLERIADMAVNVSEEVIYLVEGEIVRHQHGWITESHGLRRGESA